MLGAAEPEGRGVSGAAPGRFARAPRSFEYIERDVLKNLGFDVRTWRGENMRPAFRFTFYQ